MLRISEGWEKRDWGSGTRTWRRMSGRIIMRDKRYRRGKGLSEFAQRLVTKRHAKRRWPYLSLVS